jgi:hypothetical protein
MLKRTLLKEGAKKKSNYVHRIGTVGGEKEVLLKWKSLVELMAKNAPGKFF